MTKPKHPPKEKPPLVDPYGGCDPGEFQVLQAADIWAYDDSGHDLSLDERLFVRSYVIDRNPVAALLRLNYDHPFDKLRRMATRYLANPEVSAAVEHYAKALMTKLEVTGEKIQRRIAAVAFFDPRAVMQFDHLGVSMLNSKFWTEDQIAAVQSIKMGANGIEIKLYDSLRATEMLAKQVGLQPEDTDNGEAALAAAAGVVNKIMDIFDRLAPKGDVPALPAPDKGETIQ